ncbi:MAG: hypothetical protein ACKO24_12210, partial [Leptolyngbyaceae cyanobacterium]
MSSTVRPKSGFGNESTLVKRILQMTMGGRDLWLPILVGTVVLGGLGYLVVKVSDIGGTLQAVDTKVVSTKERIDRIAEALPDMNIRISNEEIDKSISSALLTTKPFQDKDGKWFVFITLIDPGSKEKSTYKVLLKSKDDNRAVYYIKGSGYNLEENVVSANRLVNWSKNSQNPS